MNIYDEIIKIIQKSPYKLTPQREKIVEILVDNDDHLICTNCNNIEKVSNPIFNKLIEYMKKEYSFEVQDNSLSFYGTCAKCKDKGEN